MHTPGGRKIQATATAVSVVCDSAGRQSCLQVVSLTRYVASAGELQHPHMYKFCTSMRVTRPAQRQAATHLAHLADLHSVLHG
jgi:hypothetical protein